MAVGWYLRFSLSYRDVEELLVERGVRADHVTVWRWVQRYAPEVQGRLASRLKPTNDSWRVDETYIRVKGKWVYLYRAVDSTGATIDFLLSAKRDAAAAERFGEEALVRRCIAFGREQEVDRRTAGQAELARILLSQLQKSPVSRLRTTWTKAAPSRRTARSDRRRHEGPKSACRKDGGQRRHFSRTRRGFYRKFPWGWLSRDRIVV